MQIDSPSTKNNGAMLDTAPPRPPGDTMVPSAPQGGGLGEMANSPQLMAMQGMAMVKDGFQLLSNGIPALAQILNSSVLELEQMVAQAMNQTLGAGATAPPPPGVAPMMGPPPGPGMAMAGGPPAGMPPRPGQM